MENEMSFTFLNAMGTLSLNQKIQVRIGRIIRENGCVDMLFAEDGHNGLVGMLIFSKEIWAVIKKTTYQLFGKLPKVRDTVFPFGTLPKGSNNFSPAEIEYLVFENLKYGLQFETRNNSGNFNVYRVIQISGVNDVMSKLKPTSSVVAQVGNPFHETGCSIDTCPAEKTEVGNDFGTGPLKNNLEEP